LAHNRWLNAPFRYNRWLYGDVNFIKPPPPNQAGFESSNNALRLATIASQFLQCIPKAHVSSDRVIMPCTHGKTRSEAIHNGEEVIEMYLEAWLAEGESIPEPSTLQIA